MLLNNHRITEEIKEEIKKYLEKVKGFLGVSDGKECACDAGDQCSIPRLERSPGEENGYPLQYSCLENYTKESGRLQSVESQSQTQLSD